ncbi:MAG: FkbM family methyltransferase [Gallionellaceae bacterium]
MMFKAAKLAKILRAAFFINGLFKGAAAGVEHEAVLRSLGECRLLVDIGANRGQFALVARHCFPNAKIISFEPLQKPAAIFRRVFSGDGNVQLHQVAIGAAAETRAMHISQRDDSSSLLPISSVQTTMFPGTAEVAQVDVRVAPLDEFLKAEQMLAPALLKLDVQGFEYEALAGCESLLKHFDWIYCECSFVELYAGQKLAWEIINWLSDRGFHLAGVFNTAYDSCGQAVQADFLCKRAG